MKRWSSLHRWTRVAAICGAALAVLLLGPIAVAVVMLRCCGDSHGADPAARIVIGLLLLAVATVAAVVSGGLASLIGRLVRRLRAQGS